MAMTDRASAPLSRHGRPIVDITALATRRQWPGCYRIDGPDGPYRVEQEPEYGADGRRLWLVWPPEARGFERDRGIPTAITGSLREAKVWIARGEVPPRNPQDPHS